MVAPALRQLRNRERLYFIGDSNMQALMGSAAGEQVFEELRNATVIALCHREITTLATGATGGCGGW